MDFNYLKKLAIGIRYQVNNSLEDDFGKICDDVLFTKKTPFSPNYFSFVANDPSMKTLHNKETGVYLSIKNTDLIFDDILSKSKKELDKFLGQYEKFIFDNINKI